MKKFLSVNHRMLYLITAIFFVIVICVIFMYYTKINAVPLKITIKNSEFSEEISLWEDGESYYVFVPGYVEMENVYLDVKINSSVTIGDICVTDGMGCDSFEENTEYNILYGGKDSTWPNKITFLKSENISTMFIDTKSGDNTYIDKKKKMRIPVHYGYTQAME